MANKERVGTLAAHTDNLSSVYQRLGDVLEDGKITEDEFETLLWIHHTIGGVLRGLLYVRACWRVGMSWLDHGHVPDHIDREYRAATRMPREAVRVPARGIQRTSTVSGGEAQNKAA